MALASGYDSRLRLVNVRHTRLGAWRSCCLVLVEVVADGVALQIVVVHSEKRERGNHDQGRGKQDLVAETQVFVHGLKSPQSEM